MFGWEKLSVGLRGPFDWGDLCRHSWHQITKPNKKTPHLPGLKRSVWEESFLKHVLVATIVYMVQVCMQLTRVNFLWIQFIQQVFIEHLIWAWQGHTQAACSLLRFTDLKSACGVGNLLNGWQLHIPRVINPNALVHKDANLPAYHDNNSYGNITI